MTLSKETVIDKIEITEDGSVQVRRATYIVEDGVRIAGPNYHRSAYDPGVEVEHEDDRVKAVTGVVWTEGVVKTHREKVAAQEAARVEALDVAPKG